MHNNVKHCIQDRSYCLKTIRVTEMDSPIDGFIVIWNIFYFINIAPISVYLYNLGLHHLLQNVVAGLSLNYRCLSWVLLHNIDYRIIHYLTVAYHHQNRLWVFRRDPNPDIDGWWRNLDLGWCRESIWKL